MEDLLITLVKMQPCLFNKRHANYKDTHGIVQNKWNSIAADLRQAGYAQFLDGTVAKSEWSRLRDRYVKAKKRYRESTASGSSANKRPTWYLWEQMQWLDDHLVMNKRTLTNVDRSQSASAHEETTGASNITPPEAESVDEPAPSASQTPAASVSQTPPPSTSQGVTGPPPSTPATQLLTRPDMNRALLQNLQELNQIIRGTNPDEPTRIGTMVGEQYRTLNASQRRRFLVKVQEAYLEVLNSDDPISDLD